MNLSTDFFVLTIKKINVSWISWINKTVSDYFHYFDQFKQLLGLFQRANENVASGGSFAISQPKPAGPPHKKLPTMSSLQSAKSMKYM